MEMGIHLSLLCLWKQLHQHQKIGIFYIRNSDYNYNEHISTLNMLLSSVYSLECAMLIKININKPSWKYVVLTLPIKQWHSCHFSSQVQV